MLIGGVAFIINDSQLQVQEFKPISDNLATIIINAGNKSQGIIDWYTLTECSSNFLEQETFVDNRMLY